MFVRQNRSFLVLKTKNQTFEQKINYHVELTGNLLEGSNKYSSPYYAYVFPPAPPHPPLSNSNSSSPLSTSAKAAADVVLGFISRAENL